MKVNIRLIYLYLFSFVGLLFVVIGSIRLTELALKIYVFGGVDKYTQYFPTPRVDPANEDKKEDQLTQEEIDNQRMIQEEESMRQRYREFSGAIAMIVVGAPLYLYHWKTIKKENK